MDVVAVRPNSVVVELTEDDVMTLQGCIREAWEALSDAEFRIRIGAPFEEADVLWEQLRQARAAIVASRAP